MIARLYIQNFRCLESLTLDFSGKPAVLLIGKNGAGKSTVLKVLGIFQQICRRSGPGRTGRLITPDDFSFFRRNRPMRFEIEVNLAGRCYVYGISFDWPEGVREARITDESLSVDGRFVFERKLAQIQLGSGSSFRLDWHVFALPVIDEPPPERTIRTLTGFLESLVLTAPIPEHMTGYSESSSSELERDASNFAACLRGLLERDFAAYAKFDEYVKSVIPEFSSMKNTEWGKDGRHLMVTFNSPDDPAGYAIGFDALSDGQKCFFLCGYLIALNASNSDVVCMWDEPDSHLSIAEVGQLIVELRKMTNRGGQFIATSHHPETIRKFSDETTIALIRKSQLDPALPKLLKDIDYHGDLIDSLIRDEVLG